MKKRRKVCIGAVWKCHFYEQSGVKTPFLWSCWWHKNLWRPQTPGNASGGRLLPRQGRWYSSNITQTCQLYARREALAGRLCRYQDRYEGDNESAATGGSSRDGLASCLHMGALFPQARRVWLLAAANSFLSQHFPLALEIIMTWGSLCMKV